MLNTRLAKVIHKTISLNQVGFIKGRSIFDNIMLTQKIVHNIGKNNINGNVVLKLEMAKAFDRVDCKYLCQVLKSFGFYDNWTDMIWRLLSNNWYSININGGRHRFFKASRGIKQGVPIYPSLFVIGSELLSILIDQLKKIRRLFLIVLIEIALLLLTSVLQLILFCSSPEILYL